MANKIRLVELGAFQTSTGAYIWYALWWHHNYSKYGNIHAREAITCGP